LANNQTNITKYIVAFDILKNTLICSIILDQSKAKVALIILITNVYYNNL